MSGVKYGVPPPRMAGGPSRMGSAPTVFDGSPRRLGGELECHSGAGIGGQRYVPLAARRTDLGEDVPR